MKLAFITSLLPTTKPDTGFEIANVAILDALRAAGHAVTAFGFARPDDVLRPDPASVLFSRMTIENHAAGRGRKAAWVVAALVSGLPVNCAKLWLEGRNKVVATVKAAGPFDAIILNSVTMAGAFPALRDIGPALLVEHNIEYLSAAQNAAQSRNPALRWLFGRESDKLRALETSLAASCRFIWCLAEEDRQMLGAAAAHKSAVLPLVSTSAGQRLGETNQPAHDIGLIGTWTWEPNLIGLKWFLAEVAPLLPKQLRVGVAGRIPDGLAAPPGVELLGRVPDATAFLADCSVTALVSRAGTGVQLKTIETLQLGLPAVATTLSMRGLSTVPENIVIADDPAAFARHLVEHVAGTRTGKVRRLDGGHFMATQMQTLLDAIDKGLSAVR